MATNIRILPENLTNKIAAGEVVERPASVAKELVENAIDAGSKEVIVEIESGGKRLIKVSDTGCGMSREDALLCLERHATSKIACDDDLFSLSTLGFRGEALPSIASVSRLTISTRTIDNVEGTEIYVEGGRVKEVKECGMAAGTVIAVRNLFFNTPARLKFMKSAETEAGHVGELLTRLAISRPDVRFTYINDGKVVFRALDAQLNDRVATMLGRPIAASLYPVSYEDQTGLKVTGLVAAPECSRSAGSHLYTYINGRFIRDKVVQHAILQAYRNFLERGRYPVVAVFIEISPGEVDVNVHPTKHEVRFREQGRVHDAIQQAVESVLKATPWLKRAEPGATVKAQGTGRTSVPAPWPFEEAQRPVQAELAGLQKEALSSCGVTSGDVSAAKVAEVKELLLNYQPRPQPPLRPHLPTSPKQKADAPVGTETPWPRAHPDPRGEGTLGATALASQVQNAASTPGGQVERTGATAPEEAEKVAATEGGEAQKVARAGVEDVFLETESQLSPQLRNLSSITALSSKAGTAAPADVAEAGDAEVQAGGSGYFTSLSVIGQFNASYILCQSGTDLVLIDQHAAHERVAFERLKREFAAREVDSQGLLFPETIDLSFKESAVLLEHLHEMTGLGFELEEFGGNTWLLKTVPQVLGGTDYIRTIRDILEELGSLGRSRTFTDIQEDILARLACHSVVRGRRSLSAQEIAALFTQMDETDFSSNCPHGRPVMQSLTLAEIEKMFKRV